MKLGFSIKWFILGGLAQIVESALSMCEEAGSIAASSTMLFNNATGLKRLI